MFASAVLAPHRIVGWVSTEPPLAFAGPCPGCAAQARWTAVPMAHGSTGYKRVDYTITCPTLDCA